jgi:protein-S-isoprenylcysteine O-methyltransferase Ste14
VLIPPFGAEQDNPVSAESLFRIAFWVVFAGMLAMQAYFACLRRLAGEHVPGEREARDREGPGWAIARAIRSVALVASVVLYAVHPSWLGALSVPFPHVMRWIGVALGIASLAVYAWSRATLGREWSSQLAMRRQRHLVTTGPYAWIRHPIYFALLSFLASIALATANWLFVALFVFSIVDLTLRMPREEEMMVASFGDEYRAYMERTGRLFPRAKP